MSKPLSERINDMREAGGLPADVFNMLDECIALARRVERATQPIKIAAASPFASAGVIVLPGNFVGSTFILVPVEGGA